MKKSDFTIIILVVLLAGIILLGGHIRSIALTGDTKTAYIYVDGEIIRSIPVTIKENTINVDTDYGRNIVKVHDDGVEIIDADCPDGLCTRFGFKSEPGDQIVCLPHHLYVEVR